jgi:predicted N-acyltransferase
MDIQMSTTIQDIDQEEWTSLVGTESIEQSYAWFRVIEDAHIRNMNYLFLREGGSLKAATCWFPDTFRTHGLSIPLLEVGSPLGMSISFFSHTEQHTRVLLETLSQIQHTQRAAGMMIIDLQEWEASYLRPYLQGYTRLPPYENTYIDLHFSDFDEYLKSLPSKNRRSVRITLNRAEKKWNLKKAVVHEFSQWKEVAHRLQGYVCAEHHNFRWHLPLNFYDALEVHLQDAAEITFIFKDDIPLVFALSLNTPTTCRYKFVGIDPDYRQYHAYFLLYYEGIRRAIERNQKRIYFGTSNYRFKEKIGCIREPLYGFLKFSNPVLNFMAHWYVKGMEIMHRNIDFT